MFSASVMGKVLSINLEKSYVKGTHLLVQLVMTVGGPRLPVTTDHRRLGVVLDGPRLT